MCCNSRFDESVDIEDDCSSSFLTETEITDPLAEEDEDEAVAARGPLERLRSFSENIHGASSQQPPQPMSYFDLLASMSPPTLDETPTSQVWPLTLNKYHWIPLTPMGNVQVFFKKKLP